MKTNNNERIWSGLSTLLELAAGFAIPLTCVVALLMFSMAVMQQFPGLWWLPCGLAIFLLQRWSIHQTAEHTRSTTRHSEGLSTSGSAREIAEKARLKNWEIRVGHRNTNIAGFEYMSEHQKKCITRQLENSVSHCASTVLDGKQTVMVSPQVMDSLSQEELLAAIAHEMAHLGFGHIRIKLLLSMLTPYMSLAVAAAISAHAEKLQLGANNFLAPLVAFVVTSTVIRLVLARISRQFEIEADKFAIAATNNPHAYKSALEKIGIFYYKSANKSHPFATHPCISYRLGRAEAAILRE